MLTLAPDAASVTAGRKIASAGWSDEGATESAVWGLCKGSGKNPYQTIVDVTGPAYKCSCPSRKFPCKHALGLLLRWSAGTVPDAERPAPFAATWLDARAAKATATTDTAKKPRDPEQAAKTAAARRARVDTGVAELLMWADDQIASGLAGADVNPYARFDPMAARLVDAQASGLARRIRRLPEVITGAHWPADLLTELGSVWALARAHQRLDELEPALADSVRRHVGYSVPKDVVLATPGVEDTWVVLGTLDTEEDRLLTRRTWLYGRHSQRYALLLDFAPPGASLPGRPPVGVAVTATLHYYPGAVAQRAVPAGELTAVDAVPAAPLGLSARAARNVLAQGVAADPWLALVPVAVDGRLGTAGQAHVVIDDAGDALPLRVGDWASAVAISAGAPVVVFGELSSTGLKAMSMTVDGRVWPL